jgi:hypothetical protein
MAICLKLNAQRLTPAARYLSYSILIYNQMYGKGLEMKKPPKN